MANPLGAFIHSAGNRAFSAALFRLPFCGRTRPRPKVLDLIISRTSEGLTFGRRGAYFRSGGYHKKAQWKLQGRPYATTRRASQEADAKLILSR